MTNDALLNELLTRPVGPQNVGKKDRSDFQRILTLDIESSPNFVLSWGTFKQTINMAGVLEPQQMISFAAKWYGEDEVLFYSNHHDGHDTMVEAAHGLLSEADVLVTYNGVGYDVPHLNREFLLAGLAPAAPWQNVDLFQTVKHRFRFHSSKLDEVAKRLELGSKTQHSGMQLWVDTCVHDDPEAWDLMRTYNKQDVVLTEQLYDALLPWINGHPHVGLYAEDGSNRCQRCGSIALIENGLTRTPLGTYRRYQCEGCKSWSRGRERIGGVDARGVQ